MEKVESMGIGRAQTIGLGLWSGLRPSEGSAHGFTCYK